jgi:phage terminase small subunit
MATKKGKVAIKKRSKAGNTQEDAEHRRKLFVEAYLTNGGNASQAAVAAGFSGKTASAAGSRLLKHVEVLTMLQQRRKVVIEKMELTTERTLREIARLAYVDPRKFFHADGSPKEITELDDDTAAALAGMEVTEEWAGSGKDRVKIGVTKKYKLADKNAALEKAMKHLGQYEQDNKQRSPLEGISRDALKAIVERLGARGR